jgi:hypothetical protein
MKHEIHILDAAKVTVGRVTRRRMGRRGKGEQAHQQIIISDAEGTR